MQVTCPCCSARFPIEAALADDQARQAVAAALRIPAPLGDLVLRYVALFRPEKKALSWKRAARLITELSEAISAAQIERKGRMWPAPIDYWRTALEQMVDRPAGLTLPLTGHGYLFQIIASQAEKGEARTEKKAEEQKIYRNHRDSSGGPTKVAKVIDREAGRAGAAQLLGALKGGGGGN